MSEKGLTPYQPPTIRQRSLEVTRTYLGKGNSATRSIWVKVAPRNPLLKAAMALPVVGITVLLLLFALVMLGFMLLALALLNITSRHKAKSSR